MLKSSKKFTYESNLLKILEIRQNLFFLDNWGATVSFKLLVGAIAGSMKRVFLTALVPALKIYIFWFVNTFFLKKPRWAKWWNFQKRLCLYNFHFLAIWKWMFSRNCHSCQSNNVCSHIWNKLHWKLLQSTD